MRWEEFWWNNITGARSFVREVEMALEENKMVVLKVPSDLPWRNSMRSAIQTAFDERNSCQNFIFDIVDAQDEIVESDPGRYILNRYANSEVKHGYREKSKYSIQEYIITKQVLRKKILLIKGLSYETAQQWIQFCKDYFSKNMSDGLFILETHEPFEWKLSKRITCIDFDNYVSTYDLQLFNSFILNDYNNIYSNDWKKYIAAVVASVCMVDAEVSELLIRVMDFHSESIISGLEKISQMPEFCKRGSGKNVNHPLKYYRQGNIQKICYLIWQAQIQILFPLIELERVQLVEKWDVNIQQILNENTIIRFEETLKKPMDVDLGALCYMLSGQAKYQLFIPNEQDVSRIKLLHRCRNKLAHVNCCSPEEIRALLDKTF